MKICYKANIVTKETVLTDSFVTVEKGIITYVGKDAPKDCEIIDYSSKYIMAGFIDIHCHASASNMATDNPKEVGEYHKKHGTTSMLLTYYRDVPHEKLIDCLKEVKALIGKSNVIGAHLEGPILNANFGTGSGNPQELPDRAKYGQYIASGAKREIHFYGCRSLLRATLFILKFLELIGICEMKIYCGLIVMYNIIVE